jgi:type III pantothenate kinase
MDLLIDIGNTRIKWATLTPQGLSSQAAAAHAGWNQQQLIDTVLQATSAPSRVFVSNVGGLHMADLLQAAVQERWQLAPRFVATAPQAYGVSNGYADHRKLGVDRWLGIIAAHAMQPRAACIVSVGTAMTIDGVTAEGKHLGGVIVPGPDLMVSSLMRNTSDIMRHAEQGEVANRLFADNTLGAVSQGAKHAAAALIERAIDAMRVPLQTTPILLLTGGAATGLEQLIETPCVAVPDLVLRGLSVIVNAEIS